MAKDHLLVKSIFYRGKNNVQLGDTLGALLTSAFNYDKQFKCTPECVQSFSCTLSGFDRFDCANHVKEMPYPPNGLLLSNLGSHLLLT